MPSSVFCFFPRLAAPLAQTSVFASFSSFDEDDDDAEDDNYCWTDKNDHARVREGWIDSVHMLDGNDSGKTEKKNRDAFATQDMEALPVVVLLVDRQETARKQRRSGENQILPIGCAIDLSQRRILTECHQLRVSSNTIQICLSPSLVTSIFFFSYLLTCVQNSGASLVIVIVLVWEVVAMTKREDAQCQEKTLRDAELVLLLLFSRSSLRYHPASTTTTTAVCLSFYYFFPFFPLLRSSHADRRVCARRGVRRFFFFFFFFSN